MIANDQELNLKQANAERFGVCKNSRRGERAAVAAELFRVEFFALA